MNTLHSTHRATIDNTRYQHGMELLLEVTEQLSVASDLAAVLKIVRSAARALTACDGATFVLRDNNLCHYVDEDAITPLWKGKRFPISACISGWSMLNQATAIVPDIYKDARIPHAAYLHTFVKSLVMVPIRREAPLGAIGNYWAELHTASDNEVRLLQLLAEATGRTLERLSGKEAMLPVNTSDTQPTQSH